MLGQGDYGNADSLWLSQRGMFVYMSLHVSACGECPRARAHVDLGGGAGTGGSHYQNYRRPAAGHERTDGKYASVYSNTFECELSSHVVACRPEFWAR